MKIRPSWKGSEGTWPGKPSNLSSKRREAKTSRSRISKLDEIKRALSSLRGVFSRWNDFYSRYGEPIKAIDDYGIKIPPIVIGANGEAACLAQDTRLAITALDGHRVFPPALRGFKLEDAIAKFPAWPTGAISAARNKAFLENLPVELEQLAKIYVELGDLETQLEFAPLSVLEAAPAGGPPMPNAEARGDASGKPSPATPSETPPIDSTDWRSVLAAVDENSIAIINIASDATKTTEQKMRAIYAIDNRVVGWDSPKWACVLIGPNGKNVSEAMIRKTHWWKEERPRLRR